jgi:exodeoxyribonuclease VII small subunit
MSKNDKNDPGPVPVESLNYEGALQELEDIVAALEAGNQTLEGSLKLFGRGNELAAYCANLLNRAELQVKQIVDEKLIPFTPAE